MKKPTFSKAAYAVLFLFLSFASVGQTLKPFAIRKKVDLKGKMLVIGNNILGKDNNPLNDNSVNENISMQYIDIDGDASTFSSSSADLVAPTQKNGTASSCYRVSYAALYWGAMLQSGSRANINKVKLKLPGSTTYNTINGTVIYDAISTPIVPDNNTPYACYADVTSLLASLPSLTGTYTVADVLSSTGFNGSTGLSAGWTLFVVYEDPTLNMKSFTVFDGFSALYDGHTEVIPVSGFRTPQSGNVDLQFAYAALDGDKPRNKSKLEFGTKEATTPLRGPANNFFNSTIENSWGVSDPRNPSGSNTLGYDTGMFEVKSAQPEYIKNDQTSTNFTLQVASGQADPVFSFMGSYAVDIIAPDIKLTKLVRSSTGTDIGGTNVTLGDYLYYEINYQNLGNDNVTGMTIKDVLPKNIIFNYPSDLVLTNAGGVTVQSYDPITKTIIFKVPDASVQVDDPNFKILIKAQVVPDCNMLTDACSNEIKNQAVATYKGVINTNTFTTDSFSSTGCDFGSATPTNFLVKIDNCKFTKKVVLCNNSVILTAPNGYDSYVWSKTLGGSSIGTGPTYTATQTGTYYVHATSLTTCLPIDQEITVVPFGNTVSNPVIPYAQAPYAGSVTTCTINGKLLPNLFLCGANDFRDIKTGITDATSIIWEKLNENGTCLAATSTTVCANENASCSWSQVGTGPDYKANTAGQFRLTINYTGGCFSVFYFNVFQNLLNPTVVSKDITCNTTGQITVNGIPASGYEYSLDNGGAGTYQASNIFNNVSAGLHNVYIRQVGVTNACLFKVLNVQILNRIYQVSVNVKQPLCDGGKGSVILQANNVLPQYYFSISQGATQVNAAGPLNANDFTFSNLNPGTYTVRVWTDDGCDYSQNIDIINPPQLTATATLTKPLTCTDGEITIYPVGGTAPYIYYINSTTNFQSNPIVAVTNPLPAGGIYNITVEDSNNCRATTSAAAAATPAPVFAIQTTNVLCYGDASGVIQFNVTSNAGGYTLSYSIDGGTTYSNNPVFSNLVANTVYTPMIRYTLDGVNYCYDTKPTVTLTGPSSAVTASAGVSELAGCGPSGEGKIRITNPQGGVFPYVYSFDNQATWITSNEAYKMPGTYTVYIKDANGCIYAMPNIIIDPKPVAPTIDVDSPVYNCDGTANTKATITNPGSANYQYGYLLDGAVNANSPPNVFVNIPSGSHTVSVTYNLVSVPTYSNLLNEDFGSGSPTTTSGIASAYCFNDQHVSSPYACGTRSVEDNQYSVASFFWRSDDTSSSPAWYHYKDHTSSGTNANGRYLLVNIGSAAGNYGVLYSKPIVDVIPNQPVKVDLYLGNLLRSYMTNADCDFIIELVDPAGVVVASQSTGIIPKNEKWNLKSLSLNPGPNTSLTFKIRSGSIAYNGNDAVIDDIRVYQLPKSCITQVDFPFVVPTGKAFSGSVTGFKDITCAGANNGEFTIAVQNFDPAYGFDYSINGGSTWVHKTSSPVTITGLAANTYTPLLRYNAAGACPLTLTPVTIKAPAVLTVGALVTTLPTCTTGATITASAGGGTPAYEFELRNTTGGAVVQPYQTNAQFTNVAAGNYTVFARDANGCITSIGAAVNVVAPPTLTATLGATTDYCYTTADPATLVVDVTGGVGPFTYKLDGNGSVSSALTTFSFANVTPGTHNILVTDSNNCTATISNINVATQLQLTATLVQDLTCLVNASITTAVTGGNGAPYTYTVSYNGGAATAVASFPYTATLDGNYIFTVTDSKGCSATSNTVVVSPKTIPTLTFTKTDITCNNANDGTITVTASNGFTSAYTYVITPSAGTLVGNKFTGLAAGTYAIKVIDSKGCESAVSNVTIVNPPIVVGSISATDLQCSSTGTVPAVVTVTASGGTGALKYSFNGNSNFTNANTFSTSVAGNVTAYVQDANGCQIGPLTVTIGGLDPITDITIVDNGYDCSTTPAGGQVTLTAVKSGATNPMSYQIISGPAGYNTSANTTGIFQGLAGGSYIFQATDTKTNCTFTKPYTVNGTPAITAGGSVTATIKCFGGTGDIQFTISGVSASGYDYVIKDSGNATVGSNTNQTASTVSLNNVAAGSYTITVTDRKTQCKATYTITLGQPSAAVSITSATPTHVNCNNYNSQITVIASGGTPNYSYAFAKSPSTIPTSAYGSSTVLTVNTNSGADLLWDIYVKDVNGCSVKTTVTVVNDGSPSVSATVPNQCSGTGSSFTITATGTGLAPLTYSINGTSFQSSNIFTVAPGTYTVTIKDKNGCTASTTTPITVYPKLTLIASPNVTCSGPSSLTADVTLIANYGNSTSYTYDVSTDGGTTWAVATNPYNTTVPGIYNFRVTDANGCPAMATTTIVAPTKPSITVVASLTQIVNCNGEATGALDVTIDATKGQAPFVLNVHNDTYNISYGTQTSGLRGGDYTVTVTDAKGCTDVKTAHIVEPTALKYTLTSTPITCASTALGSITLKVDLTGLGGTSPYTYILTNNAGYPIQTVPNATGTDHTFTGLNFGTYYVTVVDANGCLLKTTEKVASPPNNLDILVESTADCTSGGRVKVTAAGPLLGSGPFYFAIYQKDAVTGLYPTAPTFDGLGNVQAPFQAEDAPNSTTFTGLLQGVIYSFIVYDKLTGCSYIKQALTPTIKVTSLSTLRVVTDVTCRGAKDGTVSITLDKDPSAPSGYIAPLTVDYEVYDSKTNLPIVPANSNTGIAVGAYPFPMPLIGGLAPGSYYVVITEHGGTNDGCKSATLPFDIYESLNDLELTATVVKKANCNPNVGQIVAVAKGGTTVTREDPLADPPQASTTVPYMYKILPASPVPVPPITATNPGSGWDTANTFSNLAPNDYVVYVMDANKCIKTFPITLGSDLEPSISKPAPICYDGNPFTFTIPGSVDPAIVGGATYSVNGSPYQSSPDFTFNAPGIYHLFIKDGNDCLKTIDYEVKPQVLLQADLTQDLTCTADASITLTPSGGTGTYNGFEVSTDGGNTFGSATSPYSATVDGSYIFRVKDNQVPTACPAISNAVTVTPKTTPTASSAKTDITCINDTDGTITITPANGIAPYTFKLSGAGFNTSGDATGYYSGLPAGTYTFVVTDAKGCTATDTVVIDNKTQVTATSVVTPFGCNTSNAPQDAIVTISAGGGKPGTIGTGYTYSFDNGATFQASPSFTVNTAQTINYVVHDVNGCSFSGSAIVLPYSPPTDMNITASPIYCTTPGTVATVTINAVTGGVAPYTFEIISPASAVTPASAPSATPFSFANLAPNIYIVKVTDANGCSTTKAIEVKEANKISVTSQLVNDVYCKGDSTGAVNFTVSNYITAGNYTVSLTPGSFTPTQVGDVISYAGLPVGSYTFTVTDGVSGCQASVVNFAIKEPMVALSTTSVATNINCNNDTATVTVTANGGTAPYKYAIARATDPVPTIFGNSDKLVVDTNNGADMNWIVYVKDANGCNANNAQLITLDTNPTIANAVATQCPSSTGTYYITVNATGFSPSLQYSVDGVSFQSGSIITVNAPGTYNVTVRDANGCVSASTPVSILQPLIFTPTVTTLPSCSDNDGVITVSTTGGSGIYVYNIDGGAFGAATTFNNVTSGSHSMGVRDTTTLCDVFVPVTLSPATPITGFTLSPTPVTCNGGSDGRITATMATPAPGVNDNPVYTYVLNGATLGGVAVTRPSQSSPIFNGLAAGSYTIIVKSSRGCTDTKTIPVTEPAIITVPTPTPVQFGCTSGSNATNFATITVNNVTGGSGTYTIYEFFKGSVSVQRGSSNVYTETDLAGGSYTVTVYDDKGCPGSASGTITIAPFTPMDKINVVVNQAIDCNNRENITVKAVNASGVAIAGVQYTLVDKNATTGVSGGVYNQTNTTGVFTGLSVANYIITATNLATGCTIQDVHYVNEPNTFDLTIDNIVDVTCFGGANGSANVTIIDRGTPSKAGAFSYTLVAPNGTSTTGNSATAGPLTLNGLVAGNYTITATLTNNPFCSVTKVFTISQPNAALKISETHTPITCAGNDGTISATAIGGWPGGYEFALAGPVNVAYSTQSDFANLSAGLYTVSVRDSKGCVDQIQVTLVNPTPITSAIVVDKPMLACFGDTNATITVQQPVGGSGVYKYTLEATYPNGTVTLNGPQTSNVFTNLGVGSYKVIVSDTWSCSVNTNTVVINQPTVVTANLVKTTAQTCLSPATLTLSASGGTGIYTYSADPNFATVLGSFASSVTITVPFTTVPANYVYYVKDANGCANAVSNSIDVIPLEPLDFTFENVNPFINCLGDNDGEIIASAKGGSGNYVYTLLDGSGLALPVAATQLTPGHFTQLAAGSYTLLVTSGDCTVRKTITITQPNSALTYTAAVTNVTCNGNGDGKVVLVGSGGTGIIKYAISPDLDKFLDSGTFLNLAVGHYQAIIQDVNGCNQIYDFDITEPAPISSVVDPLSIKQELCSGEKTGEFAITISGGTAPYSTSIDKDPFVPNRVSFTGLSGGKHTVIVKDANLCEFTFDELLNPAVTLDPVATVSNDCVNNAPANKVSVHIDDSNNPADVTYSLDSAGVPQSSNVFTNVAPGNHFVMVQHKNGCVDATLPFTIDQVNPLTISLSLGGLNEIVATVTGGSGVYQFTVNGESIGSNNKYVYFHSGDYTVTVTDSYGCSVSATKYFEFIDIVIPPIFTPNGDGNNDNWKPTNTENYPDIKFIVYDRYGRQVGVFGAGQSWDGKYNGTELPMGDYWYILKLRHAQDDREFVGHFTLYR